MDGLAWKDYKFNCPSCIYRLQKPKTKRFYECEVDYCDEDGAVLRWYDQISITRDNDNGIAVVTKLLYKDGKEICRDIPIKEG